MHVRIAILPHMVFIAMNLTGTTTANAGVITTIDASTISWDSDNDNEPDIYFYKGSYNDAVVHPEAFNPIYKERAKELSDDLNAQDPTGVTYGGNILLFAISPHAPPRPVDGVEAHYVIYNSGPWSSTPESTQVDAVLSTHYNNETYYWASSTAPQTGTVPEPSTAIAMCFLGVVGFAGNRRRRRQVSAS